MPPTDLLRIDNDGQSIRWTNYWDSPYAAAGVFFLTWNAGAGRLLLPPSAESMLSDMAAADYVIVSAGPWPAINKAQALEILFEDHGDSPFAIQIGPEQTDRMLPDGDQGGGFAVTVWTRAGGERLRLPGKYRKVDRLPCLQPWEPSADGR